MSPVNKFHAKRTTVDGETFDSKREAARWCELKLLEKAGQIRRLRRQPEFLLTVQPHGGRQVAIVGKYRGDFCYDERYGALWLPVVEDVKGVKTAVYKLKKRIVEAIYGIKIRET